MSRRRGGAAQTTEVAQVEAPPGEEMERELTAPKIIASLAFQGSLVVLGDEGMPFNPMGMMTCEKAMQKMFCPEKYMPVMPYTNGDYTEGIAVDEKPAPCCGSSYYTISLKDYTTVMPDEQANAVQRKAIAAARSQGKSDAQIAKLYPKLTVVGRTNFKEGVGGIAPGDWQGAGKFDATIKAAKDNPGYFSLKQKQAEACCGGGDDESKNCEQGILKGKPCVHIKTPILSGHRTHSPEHVAWVVQTAPIIPTSCCCAAIAPLPLHMSIVGVDERKEWTVAEIARMALFMFTVKPTTMGYAGPMLAPAKLFANLGTNGWSAAIQEVVTVEYITIREFFNSEPMGTGNILDKLRGKKKAALAAIAPGKSAELEAAEARAAAAEARGDGAAAAAARAEAAEARAVAAEARVAELEKQQTVSPSPPAPPSFSLCGNEADTIATEPAETEQLIEEPKPRFDPETGAPIPKFDPETGVQNW